MAEAGSVWVSVIPSLKGFTAKVKSELAGLDVTVDLDAERAKKEAAAAKKEMGGKVEVKVDVDTKAARAAVGSFVKFASVASIGALGTGAAIQGLASLTTAVAPAVGALALIPAAGGAAAVGVTLVKTAFSGFGDAIGDDPKKAAEAMAKMAPAAQLAAQAVNGLKPAWQGLQLDVQGQMFDGLAGRITRLGGTYIPVLRGTLSGLASDLNGYVKDAFDEVFLTRDNIDGVTGALGFVRIGLSGVFSALAPLAQAFTTLFVHGAPYIATFGQYVGSLAGRFSLFIAEASRAGLIEVWINNAIAVFRNLGAIATNVGSIIGSVFTNAAGNGENLLSVLARITGGMANALKTPESAAVTQQVFGALRNILAGLWDRLVILWPALVAIGVAMYDLLMAAGPVTDLFFRLLVPAITAFAQAISWLSPVLGPLLAAYGIWTAAQWALNLAMSMNPITGVIALIIGLVAGVIYAYNNFAWFKTMVDSVWAGLQIAFSAIGAAAVWLWQNVFVPAWQAIAGAVSWAWNTVIWPVLQFLGTALAYLGVAIFTLTVLPFVLAWQAISAIAQWAWSAVLSPIWNGAIVPALQFMGSVFMWLWRNIVVPVWDGITAAAMWAWNNVLRPTWDALMNGLRVVGSIFTWLWRNIVEPVWNGISSAIRSAWDFIRGVFDVGMRAVQAVGQAFQNVADWVGRAWAAIREHARGPVQFVVDVVYNNGIMPVWNGIAGLFGMAKLGPVRFAEGGVLPGYTPGRDTIPAMLSGGEGILVPEAVRALGPGFVGWANRTFSGGRSDGGEGTRGYSRGGVARFAEGGLVDGIGDFFSGAGAFFGKVFTDPVAAVKELFGGVTSDSGRTPGSGGWTDALKALPGKAIEGVIKKVKEWVANMAAGGMGPLGAGAPFYVREITRSALGRGMGGHGAMIGVATAIVESALKMYANRRVPASLAFPHDAIGSDHDSVGLFQQRQAGWGTIAQRMNAFGSAELFFSRLGRFNWRGMEPGRAAQKVQVSAFPGRYSGQMGRARSLVGQYTGVTFDSGGLAAGRGLMLKDIIRPERTLSPRQTAAFERLVPMLSTMSRRGQGLGPGVYEGMSGVGDGGPAIGTVVQQLPDGASARHFAEELSFEMRRNGMATGVHSR